MLGGCSRRPMFTCERSCDIVLPDALKLVNAAERDQFAVVRSGESAGSCDGSIK